MSAEEKKPTPSPDDKAKDLANDIGAIRGRLDTLVGELDQRRHAAFDLKQQLRRHWGLLVIVGASALAVAVGATALRRARRKRREAALQKYRGLQGALRRIFEHPERVAKPSPSVPRKIAAAGGGNLRHWCDASSNRR